MLRLITDPPQSGAWNMAVDEALLESAINDGIATLRFYQWDEPTLSLGYFQRYGDRELHTASRACPCVRRHSGGGAILHDRELTYSLAVPPPAIPTGGPERLYGLAHESLVEGLSPLLSSEAAAALTLCPPGIRRPAGSEPFLCFQRRSPGDLLVTSAKGEDKIAGSAQRKRKGSVLQHGSVLLSQSDCAPELPGIAELVGRSIVSADGLAPLWASLLAERLSAELAPAELSAGEVDKASLIAKQRFTTDSWARRR